MKKYLQTVLKEARADKIRCPYCGRRSFIGRYAVFQIFPLIIESLKAGNPVRIDGFGVFDLDISEPKDHHDKFFHSFSRQIVTPILRASRSVVRDFSVPACSAETFIRKQQQQEDNDNDS